MKNIQKYLFLLILPLASCSVNRSAQQIGADDNVYYSEARAREFEPYVRTTVESPGTYSRDQDRNNTAYGDEYLEDYDYYDGSYSSRIIRFRNYSPWRNYYDYFYDYRFDPYYGSNLYYDNLYFRNSSIWSLNIYSGPVFGWYSPTYTYNRWAFNPYFYGGNFWGIYSFYNPVHYPFYNGGIYTHPSDQFYGRNYRMRPSRGADNLNPGSNIWNNGTDNSRAARYGNGSSAERGSAPNEKTYGSRPSRSQENNNPQSGQQRPNGNNIPRQTESTRAERYSPPASGNSQKSSSSEENKPRPSRARGGN